MKILAACIFFLSSLSVASAGVLFVKLVDERERPVTREVMHELFRRVAETMIAFNFCVLNTRMERLADDLGFGPPRMHVDNLPPGITAPWCIRLLRV